MELRALAALGAVAMVATAGAVEGWRHSPDYPNGVSGYWGMVATRMPTGSPVHVRPECTLDRANTLKNTDGSAPKQQGDTGGPIPPGFTPVRAVRCGFYGDDQSVTATQAELRDPQALKALVAAYHTTHVRTWVSPQTFCAFDLQLDPPIAFVDAHGVAIAAAAPRDVPCGDIVPAVRFATQKGPWVVTGSVTTPLAH